MKGYFKLLWKKKIMALIVLVSSFLFGYTVSSVYNTYTSRYIMEFSLSEKVDFSSFCTAEYLKDVQDNGFSEKSKSYYSDISVNSLIDNKAISLTEEDGIYKITTKSSYYADFYSSVSKKMSTRAKTFLTTAVTRYVDKAAEEKYGSSTYKDENDKDVSYISVSYVYKDKLVKSSPLSDGWIYGISSLSMVILSGAYLSVLFIKYRKYGDILLKDTEYEEIYKSPFHLSYWKESLKVFKSVKNITGIAMTLGIMLLCKCFALPSGFGDLGISFTYIAFAIGSMIYGPFAGFVLGVCSDTIGYFLFDAAKGAWFIGYTFQAAFAGFFYGLLLYRQELSYSRCFIARIAVSFLLNVLLGSACQAFIMNYNSQQTYFYAALYVLPKNIVYLIPQSLVLYLLIKAVAPALARIGLISREQVTMIIHKKEVKNSLKTAENE